VSGHKWRVEVTRPAQADFAEIITWTISNFGIRQSRAYEATLRAAINALKDGPEVVGVRRRAELGEGLQLLHVARKRRRGRHFVVFRVSQAAERPTIQILRLLHDSMDLARHLSPDDKGG